MTTATATRPAVRAAVAVSTRVTRPSDRFALTPPPGVETWLEAPPEASDAVKYLTPDSVRALMTAVRDGLTLPQAASMSGIPEKTAFETVSYIGSRVTQLDKTSPRATEVLTPLQAARAGFEAGIIMRDGPALLVTCAQGWAGGRGADIRRAYAAARLAKVETLEEAGRRWIAEHELNNATSATHYMDLYNADRGIIPPLDEITDNPRVIDAYLRAWRGVSADVTTAVGAVHELANPTGDPKKIRAALARCFWLAPHAVNLLRISDRMLNSPNGAARSNAAIELGIARRRLADSLRARPNRLRPTKLSDLSPAQYRTLLNRRGISPSEGSGKALRGLDDIADLIRETGFGARA